MSVPPVDNLSARSVNTPGFVQAPDETSKSGEFATTKTTQALATVVLISACVSFPEAFCSPTIVAAASGSPVASAPR